MSDFSARFDRLKLHGRQLMARVRPRHLAVLAAVAVVGAGAAAVGAVARPGPQAVHDGEQLRIQVVVPPEPEIMPGSVMEVGHLVDGFEYKPPPRPVALSDTYASYDEDFETPESRPAPKRYAGEAVIHAPPQPEEPTTDRRDRRVSRWFGFDAPERDYRAEREARRARRDARADEDRDRLDMRRYSSEGLDNYRE